MKINNSVYDKTAGEPINTQEDKKMNEEIIETRGSEKSQGTEEKEAIASEKEDKKMDITKMTMEELQEQLRAIQNEIARRQGETKKYEIHIFSHQYKGSGKCWIARVDDYKKILDFVTPHATIPNGYRKEKVYFLQDGKYLVCETGTRRSDDRTYIQVINGERKEW